MAAHRQFLLWFLITSIIGLPAMFVAAAGITPATSLQVFYSERLPNLRAFPEEDRLGVADAYIKLFMRRDPRVGVFMGDSQFYGVSLRYDQTAVTTLNAAGLGIRFFNLSIVDGRDLDKLRMLRLLALNGLRPEVMIINVHVGQYTRKWPSDFSRLPSKRTFPLFAFTPQRVRQLIAENASANFSTSFNEERFEDDLYAFDRKFETNYRDFLQEATKSIPTVIVVMAPHAVSAFARSNIDERRFMEEVRFYLAICKEYRAICVDWTAEFPFDHFIDIMHMNYRGHEALARRLGALLQR